MQQRLFAGVDFRARGFAVLSAWTVPATIGRF
jgi:hypothetical protein